VKFSAPLLQGEFLKRYKRFFADVKINGEIVVAHVPNTGSLKSVNHPGQPCLVSPSDNPERKLKFTLEMIQAPNGAWVGVNTATPNKIIKEAAEQKLFAHWQRFSRVQSEVKISAETRLDLMLFNEGEKSKHYIEIKNTTLMENGAAQFPDSVTERGQKHLRELMKLKEQGHSVEIVFTVQRGDAEVFAPADDIDPEYGKLLREAHGKGVIVTPVVVELSAHEVKASTKILPLRF
jgi:sugar fermentation stimulation protein A